MRSRLTLTFIVLAALAPWNAALAAHSLIDPVVYPYNTIGTGSPWIIWQDIYHARLKNDPARYRIKVRPAGRDDRKALSYPFAPERSFDNFFAFRLPAALADGDYEYTIERTVTGSSMDSRYYHYLRYPIKTSFILDSREKHILDGHDPERVIQYLYRYRNNTLQNGYNSLFFLGSGAFSFGIGMLFYAVIDFGIVSTVVYVIAFTSSATGLTAAGYYGVKYFREKRRINKILDIEPTLSLGAGADRDGFSAGLEKRF